MESKRRTTYSISFDGKHGEIQVATTCFTKALAMAKDIKPKAKVRSCRKAYDSVIYIEG